MLCRGSFKQVASAAAFALSLDLMALPLVKR